MNTFQPRNGPRFVSESESTGSARPLYYYLYLVAITLTVAAHLGWKAYIESFWHDEAWVAESILLPDVSGMLGFTDPTQITPPLYLFAVRGLVALFGDSEFVFRLVSLFCVIFAFPLCYRFLLQAFQDHRIALAGVACLALSHFATRYGAELKPYSAELLSAFLTLNAFFAGGPWSRDTKSQYHWWIPIAIAAFSLLVMSGAYTSALLFFPALGLRTLEELSGRRWRRGLLLGIGLLLALVVSALFFVFYLQPRTGGAMMQNYWNHAFPSLSRPRELGLSVSLNLFGLFQYYFFQVKALAALLLLVGLVYLWRRNILLALLVVVIPLEIFILSLFRLFPADLGSRLTIFYYPLLLLCLVASIPALIALLNRLRKQDSPSKIRHFLLPWTLIAMAVLTMAYSRVKVAPFGYDYEPIKQYYAYLVSHYDPASDEILVYHNSRIPWRYYNRKRDLPFRILNQVADQALFRDANPAKRYWIIITRPFPNAIYKKWDDEVLRSNIEKNCKMLAARSEEKGRIKNGSLFLFQCP